MEMSTEVGELFAAKSKAQAEVTDAVKDAKNPHLRNRYASLESVLASLRQVYARHGLSLTQWPEDTEQGVRVVTVLGHSSGQWMRSQVSTPVQASKGTTYVQAMGSAVTYLRRYALMSMGGIAPEDDDGNAASSPAARTVAARKAPAPEPPKKWEPVERSTFFAQVGTELKRVGVDYDQLAAWCEANGRPRPSLMPVAQRAKLVEAINGEHELAMTVAEWAAKQAADGVAA